MSKLGNARLGSSATYSKVRNNHNRIFDAIIADTATVDGLTLITNDKRFYNKSKEINIPVLTLDELLNDQ